MYFNEAKLAVFQILWCIKADRPCLPMLLKQTKQDSWKWANLKYYICIHAPSWEHKGTCENKPMWKITKHFALKPCSTACFRPSTIHILSSWTAASHCKKGEIWQTRKLWLKVTETQQNCKFTSFAQWFCEFQQNVLQWIAFQCNCIGVIAGRYFSWNSGMKRLDRTGAA